MDREDRGHWNGGNESGRDDPFFPVGNGEALAAEIPSARLLVLDAAGTALPETSAADVAAAMLAL